MKNVFKFTLSVLTIGIIFISCGNDDDATTTTTEEEVGITELSSAFDQFSDAVTVTLSSDGTQIDIETTGFPNHTSIYWETDHALYVDESSAGVVKTTQDTYIGGGTGEASSFIVDATPNLTGATVDTQLNTVGIAVSGAAIFNDQEGAGDLDQAAGSLDYNGAHKGPGVYHYHLEPKSISNDDDELVGILLDGVFLYGRKCNSTGTYPTDLDASGGHTSTTQYEADELYHYHIINEEYNAPLYAYDEAIVLFAGPFQGY
ncbi:YHYH protein [Olleya sp. R77988]|uniref:YHYH protein n=1 Tax=Olleya sp. R77988 TaxID=3093875 RepID=UPI0037CB94C3